MKKKSVFMATALCAAVSMAAAQDYEPTPQEKLEQETAALNDAVQKLRKFKASGYIQAQYQWAQPNADGTNLKVGAARNSVEKAEDANFGRIGLRRGYLKLSYEDGLVQGVFQPSLTEKSISVSEAYLAVKDPWFGTNAIKAGIFDRPFGYEIAYSSSKLESAERARIVQALFPDERDVGAMLTLQPAKASAWHVLKLEAGLFAGNGIRPEIDSRLDFIGRFSASQTIGSTTQIGGGVSAYLGGVLQTDSSVFVMKDKEFVLDSKNAENIGRYAPRRYFGIDFQFATITAAGQTQLRAEYIFGNHSGSKDGAYDFKPSAPYSGAVYMRSVAGGYVVLTQDVPLLPLTIVLKYDWYDPNTATNGDAVKSAGDVLRSNVGGGVLWRINSALRLTCYFDMVQNEISNSAELQGAYDHDRKDNVFTLRLQYKF